MTGMSFYHDHMDLPLPQILHTGVPHHYWGANSGETEREFSARRAKELDRLIEHLGPDNVGAFIGEPVLGTGGITPPPEGYWEEIQSVLKEHDILLIADEVITGFGRTGSMFGSQHYGIEPDLITVAKGLTSAYFPLSGALVGEKVYQVLEAGADRVGAFSHGYTYSGHPIGAAAATRCSTLSGRRISLAMLAKSERFSRLSWRTNSRSCRPSAKCAGSGLWAQSNSWPIVTTGNALIRRSGCADIQVSP